MKYYMQQQSGDVASESDWRDDYNSMDIESWFGKHVDDITEEDEENWLAGGSLVEIDVAKMIEDLAARIDHPVFDDAYGDGVALIDGKSYSDYTELAAAFDIDLASYE